MLGTNIVLLVQPSATIVAEVVSKVLPLGVKLKRYFTEDVKQGKRLTLVLTDTQHPVDGVVELLMEINGVLTVLETPWHAASLQAPNAGAAAGDARFDNHLVDKIVDAFPVILPLLVAFEETVPSERRDEQLHLLGARVGTEMAADFPALGKATDVTRVLNQGVVRLLKDVADAAVSNNTLKLRKSIFTRNDLNAASGSGATGLCAFCAGLIEGFIRSASALNHAQITETCCRDTGAGACEFLIQ